MPDGRRQFCHRHAPPALRLDLWFEGCCNSGMSKPEEELLDRSASEALIQSLEDEAKSLPYKDQIKLDVLQKRCAMILGKVFGPGSAYARDLSTIHFIPRPFSARRQEEDYKNIWEAARSRMLGMFAVMREDLTLRGLQGNQQPGAQDSQIKPVLPMRTDDIYSPDWKVARTYLRSQFKRGVITDASVQDLERALVVLVNTSESDPWPEETANYRSIIIQLLETRRSVSPTTNPKNNEVMRPPSSRVFVVHGHDNGMKQAVARALEKLGLEPVILHEQADRGRTVIEKFEAHSKVNFAVVLLSPDDMGYPNGTDPKTARPRARQNVILELGFFLGAMGRERVLALKKDAAGFELPSDFLGVLWKPYDDAGAWERELVKELNESGYNVNANKLV